MIKENKQRPGTYIVSYGKRHPITRDVITLRRIGVRSQAEARKLEKHLVIMVEERIKKKIVPSWSDAIEAYVTESRSRGVSKATLDNYTSGLRTHTLPLWGEKFIDEITTQEIRDLIVQGLKHRSPSHQKNVLKFVRAIFTHAVEANHIARNPVPQMKFTIGRKIMKFLTEEQTRVFLERAKNEEIEWYAHWVMAVYTGMRNGELYALTWDKVDLNAKLIKVDTAWNRKNGFKSTKSGDDRIVSIAPNLFEVLVNLKMQQLDNHFVLPRVASWDKGQQARELRLFLGGLGLPQIRFHDLRATWATLMLRKGVMARDVMEVGGWKDLKTMQLYIRKSGMDVTGITDGLDLHNPNVVPAKVINFPSVL